MITIKIKANNPTGGLRLRDPTRPNWWPGLRDPAGGLRLRDPTGGLRLNMGCRQPNRG